MLTGFFVVLSLYALWLVTGCAIQRNVLFPRGMTHPNPVAATMTLGLQQLSIDTDQGPVEAYLLPGRGVDAKHPGPLVIFAHGNGELIDYSAASGEWEPYRAMGISVALCEFRGYGRSAGDPTEQRIVSDFVKLYDRLAARADVDAQRIIIHGRSIGTGVACGLAAQRPPAALILQSPFRSVAAIMAGFWIPRFCVLDPFDNEAVLATFEKPVLIMHGTRDTVIPVAHGRALSKLTRRAQYIEYDCGHNDLPPDRQKYWDDIYAFLRQQQIVTSK